MLPSMLQGLGKPRICKTHLFLHHTRLVLRPTCASNIHALYCDALRFADDASFRLLSSSSLCVSPSRAAFSLSSLATFPSGATPHAPTWAGLSSLLLLDGSNSIPRTTSWLVVGSRWSAEAGLKGVMEDGGLAFERQRGGGGAVAGRRLDSLTPRRRAQSGSLRGGTAVEVFCGDKLSTRFVESRSTILVEVFCNEKTLTRFVEPRSTEDFVCGKKVLTPFVGPS